MADILDKIGKYFAEQEAQLQRVYSQAATHAAIPPSTPHHSASFKPHSHQHQPPPPLSRQQPGEFERDNLPGRNSSRERQQPSLLRKRLSLQSNHVPSAVASYGTDISPSSHPQPRTPAAPGVAVKTAVPPLTIPSLAFPTAPSFTSSKRVAGASTTENSWSEVTGDDGFASWWPSARSSPEVKSPPFPQIDARTDESEVESSNDDDDQEQESRASSSRTFSLSKPCKSSLKRRGSVKKKKRGSAKQTPVEPDPEQVRREKEQKVAASLVLAQKRAKRIQMEREQQLRNRELADREEQRRVQEQMEKIEAIRLKSKQFALRLRPNSAPSTPGGPSFSSPGSFSSRSMKSHLEPEADHASNKSNDTSSEFPRYEDNSTVENPEKSSPCFLDKTERQLRDRMAIELRIRERSLSNQQAQELEYRRVSSQLEKQNTRNEKAQQRLATLEASTQSLEKELARVQEQLQNSRSQRHELEETSRRERAQRQRDAEQQLRARVQAEERNRMLEDEKVRSEVAAGARERANQRVVLRASSLKKMLLHSYNDLKDHHPRRPSRGNNNDDDEDVELSLSRTSGQDTKPRAALLFAPELAEFEEDGLLDDGLSVKLSHQELQVTTAAANEIADLHNETDQEEPSAPVITSSSPPNDLNFVESAERKFEWRVPPFEDRALFDRVLMYDMLSDSD